MTKEILVPLQQNVCFRRLRNSLISSIPDKTRSKGFGVLEIIGLREPAYIKAKIYSGSVEINIEPSDGKSLITYSFRFWLFCSIAIVFIMLPIIMLFVFPLIFPSRLLSYFQMLYYTSHNLWIWYLCTFPLSLAFIIPILISRRKFNKFIKTFVGDIEDSERVISQEKIQLQSYDVNIEELYKKLSERYLKEWKNTGVLEYKIKEYKSQGFSREEAITKIAQEEGLSKKKIIEEE